MGFRENTVLQSSDFVWVDALNTITDSDSDDDAIFIENHNETISELSVSKRILEPYTFRQLFLNGNNNKKTSIISRYLSKNQIKATTTIHAKECDIDCTSISDDTSESDSPIEPIECTNIGQRRVSFSTSEIRVYSITIGDHPTASSFPISLDWNYSEQQVFEIENEWVREHDSTSKNNVDECFQGRQYKKAFRRVMRLDPQDRFARILEVTGMSPSEIERLEFHRQLDLRKEKQIASFRRRRRSKMLQLRFPS